MKLYIYGILGALFIIYVNCREPPTTESDDYATEPPFKIDFSDLVQDLNNLDVEISKVLGSDAPDKSEGPLLIGRLQEYTLSLGPLTHNMATEDAEVIMVAKSVYRQGAPKFLAMQPKTELLQKTFEWNENEMKLLQTLYDNTVKTWRNFLNMCERHRVEG